RHVALSEAEEVAAAQQHRPAPGPGEVAVLRDLAPLRVGADLRLPPGLRAVARERPHLDPQAGGGAGAAPALVGPPVEAPPAEAELGGEAPRDLPAQGELAGGVGSVAGARAQALIPAAHAHRAHPRVGEAEGVARG